MRQKILTFLAGVLLTAAGVQSAWAQKVLVVLDNDEVVTHKVQKVKCIMFEEANSDEHEWVDLGLPSGTLWATCNIGADKPEGYGSYFAWGETSTKSEYSWGTYKWMTEGKSNWEYINKYTRADGQTTGCWYSDETFIGDNKTDLDLSDDAAFFLWGGLWRMPNIDQFLELINTDYTTTEWTTQNGVTGRKITSRSNGNTLFLPAAGVIWDNKGVSNAGKLGYYWSRSLSTINDRAGSLVVRSEYAFTNNSDRYEGRCIRPVRVEKVVKEHEYVDLGLPSGTLWATCNVGADNPEEFGSHFAWGETRPKNDYRWGTYKWCNGTDHTLTKYCVSSAYGTIDDRVELLPEDDAATANWGSQWQMPSKEQVDELLDDSYTNREYVMQNGVNGIKVTSLINGNSIFLPGAGHYYEQTHYGAGNDGYYWTRWLSAYMPERAYYMEFNSTYTSLSMSRAERESGFAVRPVRKK